MKIKIQKIIKTYGDSKRMNPCQCTGLIKRYRGWISQPIETIRRGILSGYLPFPALFMDYVIRQKRWDIHDDLEQLSIQPAESWKYCTRPVCQMYYESK